MKACTYFLQYFLCIKEKQAGKDVITYMEKEVFGLEF